MHRRFMSGIATAVSCILDQIVQRIVVRGRCIKLWEILVPVNDNKGNHIAIVTHRQWDEAISKLCGGLILHGVTSGLYKQQREPMIKVRIACTTVKLHNQIIPYTKIFYKQEQVIAYLISDTVVLQ